ncbi:MAG: T9SS type A sorting domain-containing protein [Bacteroidota bacterium]
MFAEYAYDLRTADGELGPTYEMNYRLEAFNRAKALRKSPGLQLPWIERGPSNVGGRTRGLVVDPDDPSKNTWFAGSVGGGVWKTTDGGQNWFNLTPDLPNLSTVSLVMAPSNPDVIYAGTGEGYGNLDAVSGDGIWKSVDRGNSWTQLAATGSNRDFRLVNRMVIDPADENTLVAATGAGIFKTIDGGQSWTEQYAFSGPVTSRARGWVQHIVADPTDFSVQYASVNRVGIFKSTDAGNTWSEVLDIPSISGRRVELAVSPSNTNWIYAAVESDTGSELYLSENGGADWHEVQPTGEDVNWLNGQGWYDNTIAVHPFDSQIVYVGGLNIYRMTVSGSSGARTRTEEITGQGAVHVDHHGLYVFDVDQDARTFRILNTNDGGVGISNDGGNSWRMRIDGYNVTQFYSADKRPGRDEYTGGTQDNGTWRSRPDPGAGSPWIFVLGGDGFDTVWNGRDPNLVIGSSQFNGISRSTDGGGVWTSATDGLRDTGRGNAPFLTRVAKSTRDDDLVFALGTSGIWRSDDFAASWSLAEMDTSLWVLGSTGQVAPSRVNPLTIWAGTYVASNSFLSRLFLSRDGGLSFEPVDVLDNSIGRITGMTTHPTDEGTSYLLFSIDGEDKIIRTTDFGETWEPLTGFVNGESTNGFPDVATYSLVVMPHDPDWMWAGTEIGLFESTDGGQSWAYADNGIPAVAIWDMKIVDDEIVAATHGRGIWSVSIPEMLGFEPPVAATMPRLTDANYNASGNLQLDLTFYSAFDSTAVFVDGELIDSQAAREAGEVSLSVPYEAGSDQSRVDVQVRSYFEGREYPSQPVTVRVFETVAVQSSYTNDFNSSTSVNDFNGTGFSYNPGRIGLGGVEGGGLHSSHPYPLNAEFTFALRVPIRVAAQEATLSYVDAAIVEPGLDGFTPDQPGFRDYVTVEASVDGLEWMPIVEPYDARFSSRWEDLFPNGVPEPADFEPHQVDLLDFFQPGDEIFIRFRLFSDNVSNGYGWVIDNLEIQPNAPVSSESEEVPDVAFLEAAYPNPFQSETTVGFVLDQPAKVKLTVYDTAGRRLERLVEGTLSAGRHQAKWAPASAASGTYLLVLETPDRVVTRKVVLTQ